MHVKNKINPKTTKLQFIFKIFIRVYILYEYFILLLLFLLILFYCITHIT
jgi:hypothetical protein